MLTADDLSLLTEDALKSFNLNEAQREQTKKYVASLFDQRLPDIVKVLTVVLLIPELQAAAYKKLLRKGVPDCDADHLAGILAEKILRSTIGGWPYGNLGAWVAQITKRTEIDYFRQMQRIKKRLGVRRDEKHLNNFADPREETRQINRRIGELDAQTREIIERRKMGDDWPVIADALKVSVEQVHGAVLGYAGDR